MFPPQMRDVPHPHGRQKEASEYYNLMEEFEGNVE